jgi:1-phosphofructokinase
MILTVTLNPCIDKTVFLKKLSVGGHNRIERTREDVSGKGINVSVALKHLEEETECFGFEFASRGTFVADFLKKEGIPFSAVTAEGTLRTNLKIFDEQADRMTEINENGPFTGEESVSRMFAEFEKAVGRADMLVVDGSVPPGVPDTVYARMIESANRRGIPTVLDAAGNLFSEGLKTSPGFVKPNLFELETLLGRKIKSLPDAVKGCGELMNRGAGAVCLSLGSAGALYADSRSAYYSPGLDITVRGFQGAGDSMVAGICRAVLKKMPAGEILRSAAAAAHASLILEGTELCRKEDFLKMYGKMPVCPADEVKRDPLAEGK